ncbi:MAG: hypothetical protein BAA02_07525 [Paenibacillaceae bacterium ZCTH02-B3]|nr:MAG: hypothetical protein BAA02_07525 [Paenibacillaceae bacterium ZCTH02-B3]
MAEEAARGREPEASGGKLGSPDPEHQPPGRDRETRDRERKAPSRAPMRLTEEEFESVKRYLLLDILLRVTDHDLRALDASWVKMRRAYRTLLLAIQDRILREMAGLRHLFRKAGIRIYAQQRDRGGLTAWFACRGYHHRISLLAAFIRAQGEDIVLEYLRPDRLRAEDSGAFTRLPKAQKSRLPGEPDG